ncbi:MULTISPECIES: alpha/beta fold hydrolase [unclassified Pseudomonas]|uniref:alpha/beta fold hydrolase n=1 Tax=unclassified Pseudomonas TaxID=196821 RepID=UPI000BD00C83|nr:MULTISPECIES: alpha/beta hydrolase [unclassified Pseudomonas]PVZ10522.1 pimeloyl-ACP methyl ester carboxylesterase [Pseudomonas sp. URIL14HWK12:I12]PVZ21948.1 pimeloyl-ACP methyl ester carboxylesterase [Pseudomonas sp. URIL14HWK12:I10]PVZ30969.1 pimeloyl-ACP methyl ester carboxylesterase [Pseudomonas sp. URIL14HWK12:I11]SNZ17439.1 Pimeloyl-ACP methyl ester carboxylesterase [Pseudomonas sp. URIL14HWK12:I9]
MNIADTLLRGMAASLIGFSCLAHSSTEVSHKTVSIADGVISYSVRGSGPLVMVLASTGRGSQELAPLADRLATRGYKVILPDPRGVDGSKGPMAGVTFHDFGNDMATVIQAEGSGPAIVAGHAYGQWIAKTIATDHPSLVSGIVLLAGGARQWPAELSEAITRINDPDSTREERLAGLKLAFFAEGNDPTLWLSGWHPAVTASQRAARANTPKQSYWAGGTAPILDLQAGSDPFRPQASRNEARDEFGDRVTVKVIPNASHALPAEKPVETADAIADWIGTLPNGK